ncbi:MAG: hypothetical protein WBP93_14055 [Pyrinomonadaceae bacterium]
MKVSPEIFKKSWTNARGKNYCFKQNCEASSYNNYREKGHIL